jgi:hypothetical protein
VNTATHGLLEHLLSKAPISVKENLEDLMQGNSITQGLSDNLVFGDIEREPAALWNLFLYAGYLKVLSVRQGEFSIIANLAIPNKEVRYVYNQIVSRWFSKNTSLESYERFTKSLLDGNILKFKEYISNYIMQSGSYFDFTSNAPEQIFHIFTLGLVAGLRDYYVINSNQESGKGRLDVVFIPKNKEHQGIILEFKVSPDSTQLLDKAKEALGQIKDKQYVQTFAQHQVKKVLAIGMAFCGKEMELMHEEYRE